MCPLNGHFLVLFTAGWGDLSRLVTGGLVARGEPAGAGVLGAWATPATVRDAAVPLGRWPSRHVRLAFARHLAVGVCAVLSILTVIIVLT